MALIDSILLFNKAYDVARPYGDVCERGLTLGDLAKLLDSMPEVEPERKKGEWIGTEFDGYADGNPVYYAWKCSACGCVIEDDEPTWNFCPYCGADMREGDPCDA